MPVLLNHNYKFMSQPVTTLGENDDGTETELGLGVTFNQGSGTYSASTSSNTFVIGTIGQDNSEAVLVMMLFGECG